MFGLLRGCYLDATDRRKWSSFYCGLCLSLDSHTGGLTRILTNSEGVLLSVLAEAQSSQTATRQEHRCVFRRFRTAQVVQPNTTSSKYAALISVLMGSSKIMDHVMDRDTYVKYFPGISKKVAQSWIRSAERLAAKMGIDISMIQVQLHRQAELEKETNRHFLFYSQAVEEAAAVACSNTAVITECYHNVEPLRVIGRMYGRIIYLLDSYRDYNLDMEQNKFNPLAQCLPMKAIPNEARVLFDSAHEKLVRCFQSLQLFRREFCETLFTHYVQAVANVILSAKIGEMEPRTPSEERRWWNWCDCCSCCDSCDTNHDAGNVDLCLRIDHWNTDNCTILQT